MLNTKVKGIGHIALWLCVSAALIALSWIDITPLFGVSQKSLSLGSVLMPLMGGFSGWVALFVALVRGGNSYLQTGSYLAFIFYLPGLCASGAWRSKTIVLHVLVPLACMVAFVMHPEGAAAPLYALYWLIPVALWFVKNHTLFGRAVAATFVAHAVGSVIWLYVYAISAQTWNALIPVVFFERLLFALALVSVYNTAHVLFGVMQSHYNWRFLKGWNEHSII